MNVSINKILGYLQVFVGMGALSGGIPMLLSPTGANSGLNIDALQDTPFNNFFIPGLILVFVIGLVSLLGSYFSLKEKNAATLLGIITGLILAIWTVTQIFFIGFSSWLQALFLLISLAEILLSLRIYRSK